MVGTLALELAAVRSASRAHSRGKLLAGCCRVDVCRGIVRSAEHQSQSGAATSGSSFHRRYKPVLVMPVMTVRLPSAAVALSANMSITAI